MERLSRCLRSGRESRVYQWIEHRGGLEPLLFLVWTLYKDEYIIGRDFWRPGYDRTEARLTAARHERNSRE